MIVKWVPATPTSFEATFNGFGMILDKDIKDNWTIYVWVKNRLFRSNVTGVSASDAKTKVELICNRVIAKMAAASLTPQKIVVARENKVSDLPVVKRKSTKRTNLKKMQLELAGSQA